MIRARLRRLHNSPLSRRFVDSALWSMIGEAVSRGSMLIALVVVARILGPASYGEFGLVRTTLLMFASFGGTGIGLMANRFVAEHRTRDSEFSAQIISASYLVALAAGIVLGVAMYLGASQIAIGLLHSPHLKSTFEIASVVLVGTSVSGAQIGIMQGLHAYRGLAFGNLVQGAVALISLVAGARMAGIVGAMIGFVIHSSVSGLVFHALIMRETRKQQISIVWLRFKRVLPILWRFSVPLTLMSVAVAPFRWITETGLARSTGFASLGTFQAAMVIAGVLIAAGATLNAPLISVSASLEGAESHRRAQYVNLYGPWYAFLLMAIPVALAPQLVALAFSPEFRTPEFRAALLLLLPYSGLMLYYQGIMRLVALGGSMWFGFMTNVVEGVALFLAFWALASYGVVGLGLAYLLSYIARIAVSIPFLLRSGIVPAALMFDRYFLLSLGLFGAIVAFQYGAGK